MRRFKTGGAAFPRPSHGEEIAFRRGLRRPLQRAFVRLLEQARVRVMVGIIAARLPRHGRPARRDPESRLRTPLRPRRINVATSARLRRVNRALVLVRPP